MYAPHELKYIFREKISVCNEYSKHVWWDGSVMERGKAGCGILVRQYEAQGTVTENHHGYRLSDDVSSTQAEPYEILLGLRKVKESGGDTYLYLDSRGALDSLKNQRTVFEEIVSDCRNIVQNMEQTGRSVSFMWVPPHVGITLNVGWMKLLNKQHRRTL